MNNYLLYSLPIVILLLATVLYITRNNWAHRVPRVPSLLPRHLYSSVPGSFEDDAALGLSSSAFDLSGNVEDGDSRQGLDDAAKQEVLRIMKRERLGFDEARRRCMQNRFQKHGIGPDGRPRDPKFVSFSR